MSEILYDLYLKCFPEYIASKELFQFLLRPELSSHIVYAYHNGKIVGFSVIHGNSISLLCVDQEYRNLGYGSYLLKESEKHIAKSGAKEILLGRGAHYVLQGVPDDSFSTVSFFKDRGYTASWVSVNMGLSLETFVPDALGIPKKPDSVTFRFANNLDTKSLINAVKDAQPSWQPIFKNCTDPILLAIHNEEIVGFAILSPVGSSFELPNQKVGSIGCVGVIKGARELRIGRQMVAFSANWLKSQGCSFIEIRYVALVDWYKKIGFVVTRRQWMGEKKLTV